MRGMKAVLAAAVLTAVGGVARADLYNFNGTDVDVEYWTGNGANDAMMVVDFGPQSYAFGYHFDTPASGAQMLGAVAANGGLDYSYSDFGSFGIAVNTLTYGAATMGGGGWPTDWVAYWSSSDGQAWTPSAVGASDRLLSNGAWDGWAKTTTDVWPPNESPYAPVPEPGTLTLAATGAATLLGLARLRRVTGAARRG